MLARSRMLRTELEVTMKERGGGLAGGREEGETQVFGRLFTVLLAVAFAEVGWLEKGQVE